MADECMCPLRPGQPCKLCEATSGPDTCPAVYLVMSDPDLRTELERRWDEYRAEHADPGERNASSG